MNFFTKRKQRQSAESPAPVLQTASREFSHPFASLSHYRPLSGGDYELYASLRESVPVIDAALDKIVRLMGSFTVECSSREATAMVNSFLQNVRPGGIHSFISVYINQLLTYGTAVAEIVPMGSGRDIYAVVNVPLRNVALGYAENGIDTLVYPSGVAGQEPFPYQNLLLVSELNPEPGKPGGVSILHGLPFVTDILLKIYNTIGVNWERVGNVRFAVTYKPAGDGDRAMSRQRAQQIADEWSKAMRDKEKVSDFVSVGDVSIKVIGADNQILESEIPVRQMLEQIVAKLSVPPFLLGLTWSSTERMSAQQADILTSELEYYRRIMDNVIGKIVSLYLRLHGLDCDFSIVWDNINLQDELELAKARYYNAMADNLSNSSL